LIWPRETSTTQEGEVVSQYDHLIGKELVNGEWCWDSDRALLYAVGVGAGL
jgi:hypothetical protein